MHESDGFVLLSVMLDANGGQPSSAKALDWADGHGLTHPVTADAMGANSSYVRSGYPTYVVLDRDMTIVNADMWPWNDATVTSLF